MRAQNGGRQRCPRAENAWDSEASHRFARWILPALVVLLSGCASVGPPLPPSLKIPVAVTDLGFLERGDSLLVDFTAPAVATDGVPLKRLARVEFEIDSKRIPVARTEPGHVHLTLDAREWQGKTIVAHVLTVGPSGRPSAMSKEVHFHVLPPFTPPPVQGEPGARGVRLTWPETAPGARYRVWRTAPGEPKAVLAATVPLPEYLDPQTEFGKTYQYSVQAFLPSDDSEVQSEPSAPVSVLDVYPPAVPAGLSAVAGVSSIDLSWNPDSEPALKGYYVYRSAGAEPFARLGELLAAPAYTDRAIQSGTRYRYAVSAVDQLGNESGRSAPAEAVAP